MSITFKKAKRKAFEKLSQKLSLFLFIKFEKNVLNYLCASL
ncbi:hypothetical protein EFP29_100 [Enterococcus phage EF-P29]|nr:hypothetical protein EFP29_100 [Enterococcus phage EF-P29]